MRAEFYIRERHFQYLLEMYESRGISTRHTRFSKIGAIVPGVAAVFLYYDPTAKLAFLHNFISHKNASRRSVYMAMPLFEKILEPVARQLGMECVVAFTKFPTLKRNLENKQFFENDKNMSEMVREL